MFNPNIHHCIPTTIHCSEHVLWYGVALPSYTCCSEHTCSNLSLHQGPYTTSTVISPVAPFSMLHGVCSWVSLQCMIAGPSSLLEKVCLFLTSFIVEKAHCSSQVCHSTSTAWDESVRLLVLSVSVSWTTVSLLITQCSALCGHLPYTVHLQCLLFLLQCKQTNENLSMADPTDNACTKMMCCKGGSKISSLLSNLCHCTRCAFSSFDFVHIDMVSPVYSRSTHRSSLDKHLAPANICSGLAMCHTT